ncbi:MAG: hypothetical protein WC508_05355 [Patescibacteria group bacterium]
MKPKASNGKVKSVVKRLSAQRLESNLIRLNTVYLFTLIVTTITLTMFWVEFFAPTYHVGLTRSFVYYAMLTFYVIYKELQRWLGEKTEKRIGGIWVFVWWTSTMLMEVISFAWQDQHTPMFEQYVVTIGVTVNYLISQVSKKIHQRLDQRWL